MTMEVLADWVSRISNVVWNGLLLYLLVGTGIVFTIRTRFIQVRKFGAGWKHLFGHFSLNGEKAGKDGHESVPGADHRDRGAGRHRQHCRRGYRTVFQAARARFSGCG